MPSYDELRRSTPPGLVALLRIPGLGPKKIKALHETLKIESLADLRAAGESGQIAKLKGFGEKTEAKILEGIAFVEKAGERILQSHALRLVAPILAAVRDHPAGDSRRGLRQPAPPGRDDRRSRHPVQLEAPARGARRVREAAAGRDGAGARADQGERPAGRWRAVRSAGGRRHASFRSRSITSPARRPTTSRCASVRIARGLSLNEYALIGRRRPDPLPRPRPSCSRRLGLADIPPELREDTGEIEAAEAGQLPDLIELADLTGTFHCHTDWSDGGATLAEMAEAARAGACSTWGSPITRARPAMPGGFPSSGSTTQWAEIDALNKSFGGKFHLFKGTECDILADGSLDYPDDLLDGFDYVVASIHSLFGLPRDEMTKRLVRAASNPRVTMLGHPTGRLLLARDGYAVDLDAVIDAAAAAGTMIEINANPHRLDLDAIHCRRARQKGVTIVINPDAHSVGGLDDLEYGVSVARRGWLTKADVWNTGLFGRDGRAGSRSSRSRPR